jgi:hypothetical protein
VNEAAAPSYDSVASPTPRLDHVEAQTSPCCVAIPRTSPERHHRGRCRPVPPGELANAIPAPFPTSNRRMVSSSSPPRPFPGHPRRRLAGFRPEPPPSMAEDPIASPSFFPGCYTRTRGMVVNLKNFPGTPVQNLISNSTCVLMILVNSVENRR